MVILETLPHIKVSIVSGGEELEEYDPLPPNNSELEEHNPLQSKKFELEPRTVLKYIESKDDASFHLRIQKDPQFKNKCDHLAADFFIDGILVGSVYFAEKKDRHHSEDVTIKFQYTTQSDGSQLKRSFKFSKLDIPPCEVTPPEDIIKAHMARLDGVGDLVVEIYRLGVRKEVRVPKTKRAKKEPKEEEEKKEVKEQAEVEAGVKKLGEVEGKAVLRTSIKSHEPLQSHQVGWGESRVIPKKAETGDEPKTEFRSKILNTDENGYDTYIVKVIFRYRSKVSLKGEYGVLPCESTVGEDLTSSTVQPASQPIMEPEDESCPPLSNSTISVPLTSNVQTHTENAHETQGEIASQSAVSSSPVKLEPDLQTSTETVKPMLDVQPSKKTAKDFNFREKERLVIHEFNARDVSEGQLRKLVENKLNCLLPKVTLKIIERDPDDSSELAFDSMSLNEINKLVCHKLDIGDINMNELNSIVNARLTKLTTTQVEEIINDGSTSSQSTVGESSVKREIEAVEVENETSPRPRKKAKTNNEVEIEIIDLSD